MLRTEQRAAPGQLEKLHTGDAGAAQPAGQPGGQKVLSPVPRPTSHLQCVGLLQSLDAVKVKAGRKLGPNSHHYSKSPTYKQVLLQEYARESDLCMIPARLA